MPTTVNPFSLETGYEARALDYAVYTEADTIEELKKLGLAFRSIFC